MNQRLVNLVDRIRHRFPMLDVRTDQCDIVRVHLKSVLVGIEEKGGEFIAQFISLNPRTTSPSLDFETTLIKRITSKTLSEFKSKVFRELATLASNERPVGVRPRFRR